MLKTSTEPIAEEWAIHDYEGFDSVANMNPLRPWLKWQT